VRWWKSESARFFASWTRTRLLDLVGAAPPVHDVGVSLTDPFGSRHPILGTHLAQFGRLTLAGLARDRPLAEQSNG
jgi:hypothetical protein